MPHATIRRIRSRRPDDELHTTRLVGAGWTWECGCGARGTWESNRGDALYWAAQHRLAEHGQR